MSAAASSLFFAGAHPPLSARLKRLRAVGAAIVAIGPENQDAKRGEAGAAAPASDAGAAAAPPSQAEPNAARTRPTIGSALGSVVGYAIVAVLVGLLGLLLLQGAAFVLYLFAVGVLAAIFAVAGLFIVALEIVVRLLPG